jgi:predicted glycosyltransferase
VEARSWEQVVRNLGPQPGAGRKSRQRRVALIAHDGTGLGHLRRLCRLAGAIQGPCAALVVSGFREMSWLVPAGCEFVHLPSLDSLLRSKAREWGREPFLDAPPSQTLPMRQRMLEAAIEAFEPDAIIVDYLALGKNRELRNILSSTKSLKYLVWRGVMDAPSNVRVDLLDAESEFVIGKYYDRLVVACDPRIVDVVQEYTLPNVIADKVTYVGYVAPRFTLEALKLARTRRGIGADTRWVVCSGGGGKLAEEIVVEAARTVSHLPFVAVDVIVGPRSRAAALEVATYAPASCDIQVRQSDESLDLLHASSDLVVCPGGYNSTVEAMAGGATLVAAPVQWDTNDEQYIHSDRLRGYYPIHRVLARSELSEAIALALGNSSNKERVRKENMLDLTGIETFRKLLYKDLGVEW